MLRFSIFLAVCRNGLCMFSCGKSKKDRKDDISNILSNKTCDNTAASDIFFCDDKSAGNCSEATNLDYDPGSHLMKYGTYVSTIFFLSLGLLFTIVAQIFSVLNVCHTPIDLIYGTHGLVAWNAIASKSLLTTTSSSCLFGCPETPEFRTLFLHWLPQ